MHVLQLAHTGGSGRRHTRAKPAGDHEAGSRHRNPGRWRLRLVALPATERATTPKRHPVAGVARMAQLAANVLCLVAMFVGRHLQGSIATAPLPCAVAALHWPWLRTRMHHQRRRARMIGKPSMSGNAVSVKSDITASTVPSTVTAFVGDETIALDRRSRPRGGARAGPRRQRQRPCKCCYMYGLSHLPGGRPLQMLLRGTVQAAAIA